MGWIAHFIPQGISLLYVNKLWPWKLLFSLLLSHTKKTPHFNKSIKINFTKLCVLKQPQVGVSYVDSKLWLGMTLFLTLNERPTMRRPCISVPLSDPILPVQVSTQISLWLQCITTRIQINRHLGRIDGWILTISMHIFIAENSLTYSGVHIFLWQSHYS